MSTERSSSPRGAKPAARKAAPGKAASGKAASRTATPGKAAPAARRTKATGRARPGKAPARGDARRRKRTGDRGAPRRGLRIGATARIVVATMLLLGILFLGVFPTRTYMRQRATIDSAEEQLAVLRRETARLQGSVDRLSDPEHVERIARDEYNLAKPGEELFLVIPSEQEALRRASGAGEASTFIRSLWGFPAEESLGGP